MTYYCPYCTTPLNFPEIETSTRVDLADLLNQRLQKVKEKPVRCPNTKCGKYVVKSECENKP